MREPTSEQPTQQPGFIVGGRNETSTIKGLKEINGIPIPDLEMKLREFVPDEEEDPGLAILARGEPADEYWDVYLGSQESLLDVLATDNDTVLGLGLTHQKLADFLDLFRMDRSPDGDVVFKGRSYKDVRLGFHTGVMSPFGEGSMSATDHRITRDDGSILAYSGLVPFLIRDYGFYEGHGTPFRVDPIRLAEFAGLIPQDRRDK